MTLKAIIFNASGSLAELEDIHRQAYNHVFCEAALDWHWDQRLYSDLLVSGKGKPLEQFIALQKIWINTQDTHHLLTTIRRREKVIFKEFLAKPAVCLRPGIIDLIHSARADGIKVGLVSTLPRDDVIAFLSAALGIGAESYFDAIVCQDSIDPRRIEADTFHKVQDALEVPQAGCLAIESSSVGLSAALAAGLGVIVTESVYAESVDLHGALAVVDSLQSLLTTKGLHNGAASHSSKGILDVLKTLHTAHCSNTISLRVRAASNWTVFERGVRSMKVADILKTKGSGVMTVRPDDSIQALALRLKAEKVGSMIVSSNGSTIDGIISERDIAFGLAIHGSNLATLPVADLMTRGVITCSPGNSIAEVMGIMTQRRIRHLPVKDGDQLVGMVSIGDVLKYRLDEMRLEANVLRDYAIARR